MLKSARSLENYRVLSAEGLRAGLVKDIYFDDKTWAVQYLVLGLDPRQYRQRTVLVAPEQVSEISDENGFIRVSIASAMFGNLPLSRSVLPVCKQYASMAFASPGAARFSHALADASPYLRSLKAVAKYQVTTKADFDGTLLDFLVDVRAWVVRYLAVEQVVENRRLQFHVLPQSVERFTWATQRILLKELLPVELASAEATAAEVAAA